jgi:hypothetical protein
MTPSTSDSRHTPWWLLGAAAMAFFATALYAWSLRGQLILARETAYQATNDVQAARAELASARRESARVDRTLTILTAPDVVRFELTGKGAAAAAFGRAHWSRSLGFFFSADKLPPAPAGHVYQLWALTPAPVSLGVLTVTGDGAATKTIRPDVQISKIIGVEVTIEVAATATVPGPSLLLTSTSK